MFDVQCSMFHESLVCPPVCLYHDIGLEILDRQTRQGWGTKVIDRVSADLREAFPDMKGLSASNPKHMLFLQANPPLSSNWSAVRWLITFRPPKL
jgi:hypothetical protein